MNNIILNSESNEVDNNQEYKDLALRMLHGGKELDEIRQSYHEAEDLDAEFKASRAIPLNEAERIELETGDLIQEAKDTLGLKVLGNTLSDSILSDDNLRFEMAKRATHDLSYLDSTENALIEMDNKKALEDKYSTMLNPEEAHKLSRDLGVELKYNKDIPEGRVRFDVQKEMKRKDLQDELLKYNQYGDYSALQNVLLFGSAISGAMPASENLATMGLSMLTAAGTAAALSKVASSVKGASNIARLVRYAQKSVIAERRAQLYANNAVRLENAALKAETARKMAQNEGILGKLIYDTYRFGKGAQGAHASLATTMLPFAADGIISTIPRASLLYGANEGSDTGYTLKNAIGEMMMGGAIGAALPAVGAVFKAAPSALGNLTKNVAKTFDNTLDKAATEASVLGHEGEAELINLSKEEIKKNTEEVFKIVNNEKVTPITEEGAKQISAANLTEEETSLLLEIGSKAVKGEVGYGLFDKLPIKTTYLTKVSNMLNTIKEAVATNVDAKTFIHNFKTVRQGTGGGSSLTQIQNFIRGISKGASVLIEGEKGALGKSAAHGITDSEADEFLFNVYKARLLDNQEEGVQAGIKAEEYLAKLTALKQKIDNIISTYDGITEIAKEAKGTPGKYFTREDQQSAYRLANGRWGSLKESLEELTDALLPDDEKEMYEFIKHELDLDKQNELVKGRSELPLEDKKEMLRYIDKIDSWKKDVVDFFGSSQISKRNKETYFNLNANIEGSQEQTGSLKALSEKLRESIVANERILNADRHFMEDMASPEDILERLNQGLDAPEIGVDYTGESVTNLEMRNIIQDETSTLTRLDNTKAEFKSLENSEALQHVNEVIGIMADESSKNSRVALNNYSKNQKSIVAAQEILDNNFGESRANILNDIKKDTDVFRGEKLDSRAPENIKTALKKDSFRRTLEDNIVKPILERFPNGVITKHLEDSLSEAVNNFITSLEKTNKGLVDKLVSSFEANLDDTAQDMAVAIQQAEKQRMVMDEFLKPLLKDIGVVVADLQNELLNNQINTIRCWDKCYKAGFRMNEVILGEITQTSMPFKGSSLSIEALSDITTEFTAFKKALAQASTKDESLYEYAFDPNNFEEIQEAVYKTYAAQNGTLSTYEKSIFKENSQAGRIAKIYLDNLAKTQGLLYKVGSGKKTLLNMFDSKKLRNAYGTLKTKMFGSVIHQSLENVVASFLKTSDKKAIGQILEKLLPTTTKGVEGGKANAILYLLERLDLEKQFDKKGTCHIPLNMVRDALLNGNSIKGMSLNDLIRKYNVRDVAYACDRIVTGLVGDKLHYGLLDKLRTGSSNMMADMASQRAKYIEDMHNGLFFKDTESYLDAVKSWGHDSMKNWYESNMGNAKRVYAILSKAGSEPLQFYRDLTEMARTYAHKIAPHAQQKSPEYMAKVKAFQDRVSSNSFWQKQVDFCANRVCGNYSTPATGGKLIAKLIMRFFGSPMIIKAGVKSITDYGYQYHDICSMGIMSTMSIKDRAKVIGSLFRIFTKDKNLAETLFLSNTLKTNTISEALLNESVVTSRTGNTLKDIGSTLVGGELNEFASKELRAEYFVKGWTDFISNKLAWIGPLTEYNRTNAGLNLMNAIGDFHNVKFKDLPNDRFRQTLGRYGITEYEWDNIFTKHGCSSLHNYLKKANSTAPDMFEDRMMFFPDQIAELTDDQVVDFMKAQNIRVSEENIALYKQHLVDKASTLINASADEMTSIPSARVQSVLTAGFDENSKSGIAISAATQFQSFGVAALQYHMGRRLAAHLDMAEVPLAKHLIQSSTGIGATAKDLFGMISELALFQYFVNEGIAKVTGTGQSITDTYGNVEGERLFKKVAKAYTDQAGIAGPVLDGVMTGIMEGRGQGGGIALSIFPVASSLVTSAGKIVKAGTRESTEGSRGKAILAQTATEVMNNTGIPRHVLLQAIWGVTIGDYLNSISMGSAYPKYMRGRYRRGYRDNWARELIKDGRLY